MSAAKIIKTEKDLKQYFRELVENAVSHQRLEVTDISQFYVVNLLDEFTKTDRLFDWDEDHYEETALAELLNRALFSGSTDRIKIFKKMGDTSLYIAGYFSDHIDSKLVDIDYYISMGVGAYKNLSGILADERVFCELYGELAEHFSGFVDVISEVSSSGKIVTNTHLLRLYERWLKTGDSSIKEKLQCEGIIPKKIG